MIIILNIRSSFSHFILLLYKMSRNIQVYMFKLLFVIKLLEPEKFGSFSTLKVKKTKKTQTLTLKAFIINCCSFLMNSLSISH